MNCTILHETRGRIRIHAEKYRMSFFEADTLEYYMKEVPGVKTVKVYERTCDAAVEYEGSRERIISALARFSFDDEKAMALVPQHTGRKTNSEYEERLMFSVIRRLFSRLFIPAPVRAVIAVVRSAKYIFKGLRTLYRRKIEVSVLDAVAISAALIRRDFGTASSVMFLLETGETLEEWTHKKSVDDLARTMSLNVDNVWTRNASGTEELRPVDSISEGDVIVLRTSNIIPLDAKVISGRASVNQASMTGESVHVIKEEGSYIYAGTVIEDGQIEAAVEKASGSSRYDSIVRMIEESEKLKSSTEDRASHLADKLVPFSLGGTLLTYLITRNVTKAMAILMVDFSCALKLAMPVSVLSSMKEAGRKGISVKGGKFMEAVADADTIVFDKTGTLTHSEPSVAQVAAFGGRDENDMLRLAACLEEHYPHSMANAVVREAEERGLLHEERHSEVEYVVAHGISSRVDGEKIIIGSYHFVFQDEGCVLHEEDREKMESLPDTCSHLYLAISGEVAAVICVADPLREEAADVISTLKELGITKTVMMTGDNERTAAAVAAATGIDEYHSEVLPEDKAMFIKKEHEAGRKVIMIGDGINDSPALSEADAGIAISDGAAIAREIADITISADNLYSLVTLRRLCTALMRRINYNYHFIMGFNFSLIVLGVAGILPPSVSAFLHNMSTIAIGVHDMTDLLED